MFDRLYYDDSFVDECASHVNADGTFDSSEVENIDESTFEKDN